MGFAAAGLALAAVGTAVTVAGQIRAGEAQANQLKYQSQIAENNAAIARANADRAAMAGEAKAAQTSLKGAAVQGRIRAALAASGVDVNTGSAADVQESERRMSKLDTLTEDNNALLAAYGYKVTSTNESAQSAADRAGASNAITGSEIGAAGTLIGNASSLGFKWSGMQNTGENPNFAGADVGSSPY